jgi:hypothetical protein
MARPCPHSGNSILCDRAGVSRLHARLTAEQVRMAGVAPSIDGDHVEVAGIGVRLWKSARQQVWQFVIELSEVDSKPTCGSGGR